MNMVDSDEDSILETIIRFNPLIKKYSRMLDYSDAEGDLVLAMTKIARKIPQTGNQATTVGYVAKSLKHEYIALSKKRQRLVKSEIITCEINASQRIEWDIESQIDIRNAINRLTRNQRYIVYLRYYVGYSNSEIATALHISRQAVNKTEKAALKRLKLLLGRGAYNGK